MTTARQYESPPSLLRVSEVQHELSLGRSKVYTLIACGELPVIRIGKSVRVERSALADYIARRRNGATATQAQT